MLLHYAQNFFLNFLFQIKSRYDETTDFSSEMQKVFAGNIMTRQHKLAKLTEVKIRKIAYNFEFI